MKLLHTINIIIFKQKYVQKLAGLNRNVLNPYKGLVRSPTKL